MTVKTRNFDRIFLEFLDENVGNSETATLFYPFVYR